MVAAFYEYFKTASDTVEGCSSVSYFLPGIQELERDEATK